MGQDGLGLPEMNHSGGQQADAGVAVLFVIPREKLLTEGAAILDAAEAIRRLSSWHVLHMLGVGQDHREVPLQYVPYWLPVDSCRCNGYMCHLKLPKPGSQTLQILSHCGKSPALRADP